MRFVLTAASALLFGIGSASAEVPKCSQIKLIVPYGTGGATDVASRVVAERLEATLKRTIVVENRPGATGNIGTIAAVNAAPDGCTLLVNATVIATFPYSFTKLGYDPFKDLVPVGSIGITPTVLVAAPQVPANDVRGLIKLSKERPSGLNYSTSGYGLQQHLVVEEIAQRSGGSMTQVPYKSAPTMITDLLATRLDFGSLLAGTTKNMIEQKQLKALAVVQDQPSNLLPGVPTTAQQGFPGLIGGVHFLLFAPAGIPKETLTTLEQALTTVIRDPATRERFVAIGYEPTVMSSAEVTAAMRKTGETFAPIIKKLNIKLD